MRRLAMSGVAAALLAAPAAAQAPALRVFPSPGLYGPEASDCASIPQSARNVRIASAFCGLFGPQASRQVGVRFDQLMRQRFPDGPAGLNDALPPGVTREAMLSGTVVATLHLTRADLWRVRKSSGSEAITPLAMSITFSNALTGEVLLTVSRSTIVGGVLADRTFEAEAARQLPALIDQELQHLVNDAATKFRPHAVTGTVRGRAGDRYVVNIGRRQGVREGDALGDASVVFADADYAIVEPMLGQLSVGQTLARHVAQPVEVLERPSVLVVVVDAPEEQSPAYLTQMAEDAFAASAGLAVTPVNASFARIREEALGNASVSPRPRTWPDYFARVSVVAFDPIETGTNVANIRRRTTHARAMVEILNHQGRVVFAAQAADQLNSDLVDGGGLGAAQDRDTVIKNAITRLSQAVGTNFKPARLRVPVSPASGGATIRDAGQRLSPGVDGVILRRIGSVSGVQGEVWAPVTRVEVAEVSGGQGFARYADVEQPAIRSGDQLAYEASGVGSSSRAVFAQCLAPNGAPSISQRGSIAPAHFQPIALNNFAAGFGGAVHIPQFAPVLAARLGDGGFQSDAQAGVLAPRSPDICFEPVNQIEPAAADARSGRRYDLTVGYTLKQNGERVAGRGLQQTLTPAALSAGAPAEMVERSIVADIAEAAAGLASRAARETAPPSSR